MTNGSQTVTGTVNYDAFGQVVGTSGSSSNPYMYAATSGCRSDGDAGLMHVGARYYDAQAGRFITRDTYLDEHPYLYCEHDPINHVDPSGHARRPGKTPPGSWPPLPGNLAGKKPKWNPDGYWEGAGGGYVWDPTGHGGGGHWDLDQKPGTKKGGGKRWDGSGNPIPMEGIAWAVIIYFIISEGSRLFPPRNLVPVP